MKKIAFDDLPQYTPWVSRILNGEEQHKKTPSEVQREYNAEKWHSVQQYLDAHPSCSLAELNATLMPDRAVAGLAENKQYVLQLPKEYYQQQIAQYCAVLEKYLEPGDTITELGAGYGAVILQLAKTWGSQYKYRAGEYTDNGLQAMRKLALNEGIALKSGKCDFFTCNMDDALYAGGGIVFTSYALMYIPLLEERFVDYIGRIKPRYCIHFEPCYEYQDGSTVHGLLCKKYIEVNDYNRNLVQVLQQAQQAGKIRIIEVQKNIFGNNPLLPISAVVWQFT